MFIIVCLGRTTPAWIRSECELGNVFCKTSESVKEHKIEQIRIGYFFIKDARNKNRCPQWDKVISFEVIGYWWIALGVRGHQGCVDIGGVLLALFVFLVVHVVCRLRLRYCIVSFRDMNLSVKGWLRSVWCCSPSSVEKKEDQRMLCFYFIFVFIFFLYSENYLLFDIVL